MEEPDEGPDRAGRIVVLRLAEQQRRPTFDIPQVDVIAERRTDDLAVGTNGKNDFRLRIVPLRDRMNTDRVTTSDRRHRLRLGEDLGVRPDADFEILRPQPHVLQQDLYFGGLFGACNEATQTVAQHRCQLFPDRLRSARITLRLLFDHPLEHAVGKSYARSLDSLEVDGREQMTCLAGEELVQRAEIGQAILGRQALGKIFNFEEA